MKVTVTSFILTPNNLFSADAATRCYFTYKRDQSMFLSNLFTFGSEWAGLNWRKDDDAHLCAPIRMSPGTCQSNPEKHVILSLGAYLVADI